MQKPLGAHQERISIAMKENTADFRFRPNNKPLMRFLRWKFRHHQILYINRIKSSFALVHSYHSLTLFFAPRNKKSLAPNKRTNFYSRNEENWGTKPVLSFKTERISGYEMGFPCLIAGRETTLSHVHHRSFLEPRFLDANIYVTKYHQITFYNFTSKSDNNFLL